MERREGVLLATTLSQAEKEKKSPMTKKKRSTYFRKREGRGGLSFSVPSLPTKERGSLRGVERITGGAFSLIFAVEIEKKEERRA